MTKVRRVAVRLVLGVACVLALPAFAKPKPDIHWVQVRDAYQVHMVLENYWQMPIGEYYQLRQGLHTMPPVDGHYIVKCYERKPVIVDNEAQAKAFVVAKCPVWE